MSKLLSGFLLSGFLVLTAQADFVRIQMGGGVWNSEITGPIQYKNHVPYSADTLGYSTENKGYAWLDIKHPIPILPNFRVEYADVDFTGNSIQGFQYDGREFDFNTHSETQMTQYDFIMYYNLLDNTAWTTIDVGLDVKYMDTQFKASGEATNIRLGGVSSYQSVNESQDIVVPMLYGRLRFDLPFDLGIEAIGKYVKYKESKISDFSIKADYTLVDILPIDIGFEVGYRFENINIDRDDFSGLDVDADLDIKGVFAGAVIRF